MSARQLQKNGAANVATCAITKNAAVPQLTLPSCRPAGKASCSFILFINSSQRSKRFFLGRRSNSATDCSASMLDLSGMTSARNLKDVPTAGDVNDLGGLRLPERGSRMRMRMNEPAHAIGKEHVHLLRLDEGRYFTFSESLMHQHLPSAICQRRIVGGAGLCRSPL